jgi:hypothetical protein
MEWEWSPYLGAQFYLAFDTPPSPPQVGSPFVWRLPPPYVAYFPLQSLA